MFKRSIYDPGLWFLLFINAGLIYYYVNNSAEFNTLVWIFWLQSVLIGVFNFFELYSVKDPDSSSMSMNGQPVTKGGMGCAAFFFLIHYGIFHFVYGVFLLTGYRTGVNNKLVLLTAGIFLIESTWQFIRRRFTPEKGPVNVGKLFFVPYLRIIPMHLMILIPSFLGIGSSVIFLVLKTFADAGMYLLTRQKPGTDSVV